MRRLDIFESGFCIVFRREEGSWQWRIRDGIFCLLAEDRTSRQALFVSISFSDLLVGISRVVLSF